MNKFLNIVRLAAGWFFSVTFILIGLTSLFSTVLVGISFILLGLVFLPPLSSYVEKKLEAKFNINKFWAIKATVAFILFTLTGFFISTSPTNTSTVNIFIILAIVLIIAFIQVCRTNLAFAELQEENRKIQEDSNNIVEKIKEENRKILDKYKGIIDIDKEINIRNIKCQDLEKKVKELTNDYNTKGAYYSELQKAIALAEDDVDILEFGLYKPHFHYDISAKYKMALELNYDKQKAYSKHCLESLKHLSNVSFKQDKKNSMKLTYRAFNAECDAIIAKVDWKNIKQMEARIKKAFETINKLASNSMFITNLDKEDLDLKLEELYLTHEYALKKQEEKEEQKRIQEQIREEQKAIKEYEEARLQAEKDERTYQKALLQAQKDLEKANEAERSAFEAKIAELQAQLQEAENRKERAISQAQLTKCGYIYVISNIGSFGENIYKIGMTRRLEPMDRINELGDASVPFKFDVHALIFSENAPELETKLHNHFKDKAVNLVNLKKEFFNVSLDEIERVVHENYAEIEFTKIAEAKDYRETLAIRQSQNSEHKNIDKYETDTENNKFPLSL